MRRIYPAIISCILLIFFAGNVFAQQVLVTPTQKNNLDNFAAQKKASSLASRQKALALAKIRNWAVQKHTKSGGLVLLQGVNRLGFPMYLRTHNTESAEATRTNTVQPGGSLGLNLSGSSAILKNKLAIWDGGTVDKTHPEFAGKTITSPPSQSDAIDHTTHVAGTLIAKGVSERAKGMAFNMSTLQSYDFDDDVPEMIEQAQGLLLSNHSYGDIAGWDGNTWYGLPGDSVDYLFGFYDSRAQAWDKMAFEAPYYLIVESAGNSHSDGYNSPGIGELYFGYTSRTDPTVIEKGPRPAGISNNTGYDVISTTGNAKNIITVGSVDRVTEGNINRESVKISSFSSWGPTDDGRVKPDLVGMGDRVYSTITGGRYSGGYSGTSMSTPNVTGSLLLLQEYYAQLHHDTLMRAATLKGLACHTAFDAGNIGPDYIYGWGLLNMQKAAQTITNDGVSSYIKEDKLLQGQSRTYLVTATGGEPLGAVISWTDPEGTPAKDGTINDRTPKLVNDLDVRITHEGGSFYTPWVLNPENPAAAATNGDNIRDNIEQVFVPNTIAAATYIVTVSHKGKLQGGGQNYSLILTGGSPNGSSVNNNPTALSAFPVPAVNKLTVLFDVQLPGLLKLSLVNIAGQTVYTYSNTVAAGNFSTDINTSALSSGVYIIKLVTGKQVFSNKVLVVK